MTHDVYQEPLVGRYTQKAMQQIFSDDFKFSTWRKCWTWLAEAQQELGIERITDSMIDEMIKHQKTIDYANAKAYEKKKRHDVNAHIAEYGDHCPQGKDIIHLGATSMYVCDNTELIQMREAMKVVKTGLVNCIHNMSQVAYEYKDLVTLGYTHFQPAQPTTVGKRFTLYLQDLLDDLEVIEGIEFKARGGKGTTGTQASFLDLFEGDYEKVKRLDQLVTEKMGFDRSYAVTGQTYPRKFDAKIAQALANTGISLYRFAQDTRLLAKDMIVDEPFEIDQTGSSAMPYKRNPMRSERMCGFVRKLCGLVPNFYDTAKSQWLERTLDDSAIRRMDIPQSFLLTDGILILANNITDRNVNLEKMRPMTFYPKRIEKLLNEKLPFMASEAIMIDLVKEGFNRQEMYEFIRKHSVDSAIAMKEEGADCDLFERLGKDQNFPLSEKELNAYLGNPLRFAGAANIQTEEFLEDYVKPALEKNRHLIGKASSEVNV